MLTPLALLSLAAVPNLAPQPLGQTNPFSSTQVFAESKRIAVSPVIDGQFSPEEWDPLVSEVSNVTYFQWEPGKVHVAALMQPGSTVITSLDLRNNGWLIGEDNVEIRISVDANLKPTVSGRILNATSSLGPAWIEIPGFALSSIAKASTVEGKTFVEASVTDPGIGTLIEDPKRKIGLRMDVVPGAAAPAEPYLPRMVSVVETVFDRGAGLPEKLVFKPEGEGKPVVENQMIRLRFGFEGTNAIGLARLNLRSEGVAKDYTNALDAPFPPFDNKGRAFLDYETSVAAGAIPGYRLIRGQMKFRDGLEGLVQTSYRIAPVLDFDLVYQRRKSEAQDKAYKEGYYIRSNSGKRVAGRVKVSVPEPLRMLNGFEKTFAVAPRGRERQGFEVYVPANTVGTFPVTFEITTDGSTVKQFGYLTVR